MGPAGSGKGTQALLLSKFFKIPSISTGNLLRQKIKKNDELGRYIDILISHGNVVDNELMFSVLEERLKEGDCKDGFILDGFPRNVDQAIYLEKLLEMNDIHLDGVISLSINNDIVIKRITGRFECAKCKTLYNKFFANTQVEGKCDNCQATEFIVRADDQNLEAIEKRLDIYLKMSKSIIEFYNKKNLIYFVDAFNSIEDIYQDILFKIKIINNYDKRGANWLE